MEYTRVAKSVLGLAKASVSGKSPRRANITKPAKPSNGPRPTSHNSNFQGMRFMLRRWAASARHRHAFEFVVSTCA